MTVSPLSYPQSAETFLQRFKPRAALPVKPGCLWRISSGFVRTLTWLEDGTIVVLGIWGAGDLVGKPLSEIEPYQIECLTKVEAMPLDNYNLHNSPKIWLAHMQQSEELMVIRSYKRVDRMLLKLLDWLAKRFGQPVKEGRLIDLHLTHQDLSDLLGATRVTITRTLSQLEQQGAIQRLTLKRIILQQTDFWHYEI